METDTPSESGVQATPRTSLPAKAGLSSTPFSAGKVRLASSASHPPLLTQRPSADNATLGSVLSYVFYWLLVTFSLVYLKWSEGRTSFFGLHSKAGKRRLAKRREGKRDEETVGTESGETKADSGLASIVEKDAVVGRTEEGEIVELPGRPVLGRGDTSLGSASSVSSKVEGEEEITEAPRR